MTSEWMADAFMREWANQSLPRSRDRAAAGDLCPCGAKPHATLQGVLRCYECWAERMQVDRGRG